MAVMAVRGPDPTALVLSEEPLLTHHAQDLFVVYGFAAAVKVPGYPAVAIAGEFLDDGLNLSNKRLVIIGSALWLVIICAAG